MIDRPTYDELLDRIEALENYQLKLGDLPLAPLQNKLEVDWQPQASVLLGERSVTTEMLRDDSVPDAKLGSDVPRFLFGGVNSTGAILHGTGFTITKGAAGVYTINFNTAFSDIPGFTFNPLNVSGVRNYDVVSASASSVQVIVITSAGAGIDTPFIFVAIGPR